jgi:hydroxyethylthiazole kinase-like sugar kinase family protein
MGDSTVTRRMRRSGRPLLFSMTETFVFVLIAAALIATAALPAMARDARATQGQTQTRMASARP